MFTSEKIKLPNVKISFPHLYTTAKFNGQDTGKYSATFLLDKSDKETIQKIRDITAKILEESKVKVSKDKICIKDGDESDMDNYHGFWTIRASRPRKQEMPNENRPNLYDKSLNLLEEDDGTFYSGCRVNAMITFWLQDNKYGKRINANLLGMQFFSDDEPFQTSQRAESSDFTPVADVTPASQFTADSFSEDEVPF